MSLQHSEKFMLSLNQFGDIYRSGYADDILLSWREDFGAEYPRNAPPLINIILKPECIYSEKLETALSLLAEADITLLDAFLLPITPSLVEKLYACNLALSGEKSIVGRFHLNVDQFKMGLSVVLVCAGTGGSAGKLTDAHQKLSESKGKSAPWLVKPGQFRDTLESISRTQNFIHIGDEALASYREFRALLGARSVRDIYLSAEKKLAEIDSRGALGAKSMEAAKRYIRGYIAVQTDSSFRNIMLRAWMNTEKKCLDWISSLEANQVLNLCEEKVFELFSESVLRKQHLAFCSSTHSQESNLEKMCFATECFLKNDAPLGSWDRLALRTNALDPEGSRFARFV